MSSKPSTTYNPLALNQESPFDAFSTIEPTSQDVYFFNSAIFYQKQLSLAESTPLSYFSYWEELCLKFQNVLGIFISHGIVIEITSNCSHLLGYEKEKLVSLPIINLIHFRDISNLSPQYNEPQTNINLNPEIRFISFTNGYIPFKIVRSECHSQFYFLFFEETRRNIPLMIEEKHVYQILLSPQFIFLHVSPSFSDFGFNCLDLLGNHLSVLCPQERVDLWMNQILSASNINYHSFRTSFIIDGKKRYPFQFSFTPIKVGNQILAIKGHLQIIEQDEVQVEETSIVTPQKTFPLNQPLYFNDESPNYQLNRFQYSNPAPTFYINNDSNFPPNEWHFEEPLSTTLNAQNLQTLQSLQSYSQPLYKLPNLNQNLQQPVYTSQIEFRPHQLNFDVPLFQPPNISQISHIFLPKSNSPYPKPELSESVKSENDADNNEKEKIPIFVHKPQKRKYKHLPPPTSHQLCFSCGTRTTPEWRKGPQGPKTLCNACGLHYAKKTDPKKRKIKKKADPSAENSLDDCSNIKKEENGSEILDKKGKGKKKEINSGASLETTFQVE